MRPGVKALVLAAALLLAACVSLPKAPAVAWTGISLDTIGLREQRFTLKLKVSNPNDTDLPLERLEFDVEVAGQPLAHAVSDKPVTLVARGETTVEVKASGNVADFLRRLGSLRGDAGSFDYRMKGDAVITGHGRLPFDRKGKVFLHQMLRGKSGDGKPESGEGRPLPGAI